MSMSLSLLSAEAIENLTRTYTANYCNIATAVLVVYEHIITFDLEVLAIWRYRMTGPTILLLFNRYVLLLTAMSNVFNVFTWTSDQTYKSTSCEAQAVVSAVTYVLSIVIAAGFSTLRVYAIAGRKWFWALLALLMGLVPAVTNMNLIPMWYICSAYHNVGKPALSLIAPSPVVITTRTCAIVSDLIVIVATWTYARPWAKYAPSNQIKTPLMLMIVRDGTGYFLVLLILNIAQMAITGVSYSTFGAIYDYITVLTSAISSILISRFMFNLRQYDNEGNSTGSNDPSFAAGSMGSRGSMEFTSRLIGNMGAPLDHSIPDSLLFDDGNGPQKILAATRSLTNTLFSGP